MPIGKNKKPNYKANDAARKKIKADKRNAKVDAANKKKLDNKPNVGKADSSGFRKYTGKKGQIAKKTESRQELLKKRQSVVSKASTPAVSKASVIKSGGIKKLGDNKIGAKAISKKDTLTKSNDAKKAPKAFRDSGLKNRRKRKAAKLDAKAERLRESGKGISEKKYNRLKNRAQRKRERAAGDRRGVFATAAHKVGRAVATVAAASGGESRGFKKGGTKGATWKTEAGLTKQGQAKKNALKKKNKK